jgi:ADP-ribosylglycohydrolase
MLGAMLGEQFSLSAPPTEPSLPKAGPAPPLPLSQMMLHCAQGLAAPRQVAAGAELAADTITEWPTCGAAIALLPVALFCHEADWQLTAQLAQTHTAGELTGLTLIARAIASLLREELPLDLIPRLLRQGAPSGWQSPLAQVQTQLDQRAGLATAQAGYRPPLSEATAIALAFYSFLSTPTAFELSLRRALRCGLPAPALALVGALSGTYNGLSGIPVRWRLALSETLRPHPLPLAHRLLATWSGSYHPATFAAAELAIAAPQVIRQVGPGPP